MKPGDAEYTALVEKKREEIRGNVSSVKLSESQCKQEIEEIVGGVFNEVEDRTVNEVQPLPQQPKKRGRPVGSKNRPKENK